jgi:transcriptional regulator with PAS, ATPase and Fis domain
VIAVDKQGLIRHANLSAARMFELERGVVGQKITIEPTGDIVYDCEEAYLSLRDGMRLHALCKRIALSQYEGSDVTVIVFQDARDFLAQSGEMPFEAPNPVKLIGHSVKMQALRNNIDKIANSAASVLITGESGSGKEVVAFSIHQNSPRRDAPFVTINCAAIPEQLLESELFGYIKGAFSGADPKGRIGKFELAQGGSIFLDEIGDMPVYLQAKLLRVLQERTITRIGSNQVINIDVRVIAASNKDIADMASRHLFREDLLYRLNVVPIVLPPLRERREDIADLAQYFTDEFATLYGRPRQKIAEDLANTLYFYDWPGNVRELRNVIEYMFVMQGDARALNASHLPPALQKTNRPAAALPVNKLQPAPGKGLRDEAGLISDALARHGRDLEGKRRAAEELGMGIATLYRKIKKYGIDGQY